MFRTPVFIVLSRCHGQKSVCIGLGTGSPLEKFAGGGGWHSENNISSWSRSSDLNWNRWEGLKIDLEWTRNGPGLDLDLSLTIKGSLQNKLNLKFFSKMQNLTRHQVNRDKP